MRITDFAKGAGWLIVPERFDELARQYHGAAITDEMVLRAEKEGALVLSSSNGAAEERPLYSVTEDGAAIVAVQGPLVKDPFLAWFFGGTTFQEIRAAVAAAAADDGVTGIVLDIDSPGGTVNGTEETADAVFAVRGKKPIVAYTSGMMASAAYWIGSAADQVIIGKTAEVGSIGVLMVHREFSELEKKIGIKTTYLKAGKFKTAGNPSEPLSDDARQIFQEHLDQLYSMFVGAVSLYRDAEDEQVRADMADGRLFIGDRAVGAGLADATGNIQTAVDAVLSAAGKTENRGGVYKMNKIEIKSYDDLKTAGGEFLKQAEDKAFTLGAESVDQGPAIKKGADEERERVLAIAVAVVGEEQGAKLVEVVKSGVTVEQYRAIRAIAAPAVVVPPDTKKAEILEAITKAGAENPGADVGAKGGEKDYWTLVADIVRERKVSRIEAMQIVTKEHPEARAAMLKKANPGKK